MKNRELHIRFVDEVNTEKLGANVTDRNSKIIDLIKEDKHISTAKMATLLSVSKRTILRDIEKLKQLGQISVKETKKPDIGK